MKFKMLDYPITSHFQEIDKVHPQPHTGVDFATPLNTPIQSLSDGYISKVNLDPNALLGNNVHVTLSNPTNLPQPPQELVYGHLSQVDVTYGQHVSPGDLLGLSGNTGHSTGPHVHISLLNNSSPVDPASYFNQSIPTPNLTPSGFFDWLTSHAWQSFYHNVVQSIPPMFHTLTLVACGILIVLHVAGYRSAFNKVSILCTLNAMVQFILT